MIQNNHEKSFYYRHCLCIPFEWKIITNYLLKTFKDNGFEVYLIEEASKNKSYLLLSQQNEEKILRQAQFLKIKKDYMLFEEPKEITLPQKVIQYEKERVFMYYQRHHFLPNQCYYLLHENKKTDERWGLGLFTEGEMLSIEKSILDEIEIQNKDKLIHLFKEKEFDITPDQTIAIKNHNYLLQLLVKLNMISDVVPLHISCFPERILKQTLFTFQCPYHTIRSYYNDVIGFYFAWIFHYTKCLFIPAFVSLFLLVFVNIFQNQKNNCLVFFSAFIPIWAQFLVISWNRKTSELSVEWDNHTETYDKENQRKEFKGVPMRSQISNEMILYYPSKQRFKQYIISFMKSLSVLLLAVLTNITFLNLLGFIKPRHNSMFFISFLNQLSEEGRLFAINSTSNTFLGFAHLGVIFGLNQFYRNIAETTTKDENHQIKSNHNNSLIIKRFIFEFLDSFFSLFYIAFVAKDLASLRNMLQTIFFGNQIRRMATETIVPNALKIYSNWNQYVSYFKGGEKDKGIAIGNNSIDKQNIIKQIENEEYDSFDDYLEPVLEFAYLTLFAECIPFASLFIIIANLIEIRSDIMKISTVFRRPEHIRKRNIGAWHMIIQVVAFLSVFTNLLFVFMFTSNSFQMNYDNLLSFGIVEHLSLFLIFALKMLLPSQKKWVKLFFERKEYRLKENKWKIVLKRLVGEASAKQTQDTQINT